MHVCGWKRSRSQQRTVALLCQLSTNVQSVEKEMEESSSSRRSSNSGRGRGRGMLWCGYWRTTKITMKWKMHRTYCKCRKTEPVYPFASFITGNWRLNVRKKERKINVCMYTQVFACVCARLCLHICTYVCVYIHNEAVPNGRCKKEKQGKTESPSVCLCCQRRVGRAPLLPTLVFYTLRLLLLFYSNNRQLQSTFPHQCTSSVDVWMYVCVSAEYNTYEHR